jgi:hypothetical protein
MKKSSKTKEDSQLKYWAQKNMKYLTYSQLANYRKKNTPKECPIMQNGCSNPCVDHDHKSGVVRGVISMEGNTFLGRVENSFRRFGTSSDIGLPSVLRNMADYLEKNPTGYLHPVGLKQLASRFNRLIVDDQVFALKVLGAKKSEIKACTNSKQRTILYRKLITNEK